MQKYTLKFWFLRFFITVRWVKTKKISHRVLWQGKICILMLSLEVCKRILGNNDNEEVKMIREYLYLLATLQIECENNVENQILD